MNSPSPDRLTDAAMGYGISRMFLYAVEIGLYTRLARGSMTLNEILAEYGFLRRPGMDFLDLLVSVDLLGRDGDGEGAHYRNTEETATFLDRNRPEYIGGIMELWTRRNYRYWFDLPESLKTGNPQNETTENRAGFFETLYSDPARLEAFMGAMNGASLKNFQ